MIASVVRDEPAPREIVRRLHREIAAKSPDHAALVAAFEAGWAKVPQGSGYVQIQKEARIERLRKYAVLRADGANREDAARLVGVTTKTAENYDTDIRHGRLP
jgi:hypothetical protein